MNIPNMARLRGTLKSLMDNPFFHGHTPPPRAVTVGRFTDLLHHRYPPHLLVGVFLDGNLHGLCPGDLESAGDRLVFLGSPNTPESELTLYEGGSMADTFAGAMKRNPGCEGAPLYFCEGVGKPVYALPEDGYFILDHFLVIPLGCDRRVA